MTDSRTAAAAGWRDAMLAASLVEAACGILAAATVNHRGGAHNAVTVFVACTIAAGLADVVLVPGWVWVPGRFAVLPLVMRAGLAVFMAAFAAFVGLAVSILSFGALKEVTDTRLILAIFCLPIAAAGAAAGMGAFAASWIDPRPGIVRASCAAGLIGGAVGALLVLFLAVLAAIPDADQDMPPQHWWALLVLAPAALVLGGAAYNALVARWARPETTLAPAGQMRRRAFACGAIGLTSSAAVLLSGVM